MKLKVYPANNINDLEEIATKECCMAVGIDEMSITYVQPADTNSSSDEVQFLTIKTACACSVPVNADIEKEGYYYDISIPEGGHWSISSGDELKALVDDFESRLYGVSRKKK